MLMGFLNFFNGKQSLNGSPNANANSPMPGELSTKNADVTPQADLSARHDIPEQIFIAQDSPKTAPKASETPAPVTNLDSLYAYLGRNLEKPGYEDSLMNPDSSHMEEQLRFIKNELALLISQVKNYYSGHLREVDCHIETRSRSGMVETVDELLAHKANTEEKMQLVLQIENEARDGKGLTENLILSYKKGFRNGFAAITVATILNKK